MSSFFLSVGFEEINLNTEFQRENNLWSPVMQSRLIESILLGLPLPAFYFDTSNKKWDIIDGLQRCCAIRNYCVLQNFSLCDLDSKISIYFLIFSSSMFSRFSKLT